MRTKRHYPDTGTYTTTDGTVTIWCPSVQQSAAALPSNLKRLMAAKGVDVPTLAAAAHISESIIRHYLRGGGHEMGTAEAGLNPTLTTLLAIAGALGVGIEALVNEQ